MPGVRSQAPGVGQVERVDTMPRQPLRHLPGLIVLLCGVLLPAVASAQPSIAGVVHDQSGAASAALTMAARAAQPPPPAVPTFTAAQAEAGRTAYEANCSGCHRTDLQGSFEAPQL